MLHRSLCALALATLAPWLCFAPAPAESRLDDNKAAPKQEKQEKKTETPTRVHVPVFKLSGGITESPQPEDFPLFGGAGGSTLKDLVARLKKAATDSTVKAIVLLPEEGAGWAQTEELRQVLGQIRKAGKDIYVHADGFSMRDYLIAAGATRISVVPTGDLWITGLFGEGMYLRGMLDMLGVKPDYLTCGDYKSAAETFMRTGPSPEAERMQNWLLDGLYETCIQLIAKGRNVDGAKARKWLDEGPYTAEKARAAGLIDAVESREDFNAMLKAKYGKDMVFDHKYGKKKPPSLDLSSPFGMFKLWADLLSETQKKKSGKDAIGIVYVDGAITLGGGGISPFGAGGATSTAVRKALDEAAKDDSIKAVVLRVDSPGGSAVASEIILDATKRVKAKKPFVVSMGDVAGSGGYYVACAADTIFADTSTITGSIGVVGGKFATNEMWKKIGISFKSYKRGANAGLLSSESVFTPEERVRMQAWMDEIYKVFKDHVVAIRGSRLKKPIDELAGGRVYTGKQALELGLVDKIGTMEDAVKFVAAQAKLTDYDVRVVPHPKNFLEVLLEESEGGKDDPRSVRMFRGNDSTVSLIDLALPHLQHMDPERVKLVKQALARLQLIQREGAVLMMPPMRLP